MKLINKIISAVTAVCLAAGTIASPAQAQLQPSAVSHQPSALMADGRGLSAVFTGIKIYPQEPFKFEFLVDGDGEEGLGNGQQQPNNQSPATNPQSQYLKLIKYFMASLTVPEGDLWVNLSPYEPDRIVPQALGQTEMGRDLLAQDYILKQLTASLMSPEGDSGKKFWEKVYEKLYASGIGHLAFGENQPPNANDQMLNAIESFNKVWIVPDKVEVYQNDDVAYITKATLKVMLENDYLAQQQSELSSQRKLGSSVFQEIVKDAGSSTKAFEDDSLVVKNIIKEIIIPIIEDEVNNGESFANLRQIFHSMILAKWYEQHFKNSVLGRSYVDRNVVDGIRMDNVRAGLVPAPEGQPQGLPLQADNIESIYIQYLAAFKSGASDLIKEEYDPVTQGIVTKKYFVGGIKGEVALHEINGATNFSAAMLHATSFRHISVRLLADSAQLNAKQWFVVLCLLAAIIWKTGILDELYSPDGGRDQKEHVIQNPRLRAISENGIADSIDVKFIVQQLESLNLEALDLANAILSGKHKIDSKLFERAGFSEKIYSDLKEQRYILPDGSISNQFTLKDFKNRFVSWEEDPEKVFTFIHNFQEQILIMVINLNASKAVEAANDGDANAIFILGNCFMLSSDQTKFLEPEALRKFIYEGNEDVWLVMQRHLSEKSVQKVFEELDWDRLQIVLESHDLLNFYEAMFNGEFMTQHLSPDQKNTFDQIFKQMNPERVIEMFHRSHNQTYLMALMYMVVQRNPYLFEKIPIQIKHKDEVVDALIRRLITFIIEAYNDPVRRKYMSPGEKEAAVEYLNAVVDAYQEKKSFSEYDQNILILIRDYIMRDDPLYGRVQNLCAKFLTADIDPLQTRVMKDLQVISDFAKTKEPYVNPYDIWMRYSPQFVDDILATRTEKEFFIEFDRVFKTDYQHPHRVSPGAINKLLKKALKKERRIGDQGLKRYQSLREALIFLKDKHPPSFYFLIDNARDIFPGKFEQGSYMHVNGDGNIYYNPVSFGKNISFNASSFVHEAEHNASERFISVIHKALIRDIWAGVFDETLASHLENLIFSPTMVNGGVLQERHNMSHWMPNTSKHLNDWYKTLSVSSVDRDSIQRMTDAFNDKRILNAEYLKRDFLRQYPAMHMQGKDNQFNPRVESLMTSGFCQNFFSEDRLRSYFTLLYIRNNFDLLYEDITIRRAFRNVLMREDLPDFLFHEEEVVFEEIKRLIRKKDAGNFAMLNVLLKHNRLGGIDLNNLNMQTSGRVAPMEIPALPPERWSAGMTSGDPAMMHQPIFRLEPKIIGIGTVNLGVFLGFNTNQPDPAGEDERSPELAAIKEET